MHVIARAAGPWQSPAPMYKSALLTRRLPRRFAPRNDVVIFTWSFCLCCGSGRPGRGVPTGPTVGNGPVPFRRTHRNDRSTPANPHNLPTCPQAVVTEGNACGAISCAIVQIRTAYREIATSAYGLLAMTRKIEPDPSGRPQADRPTVAGQKSGRCVCSGPVVISQCFSSPMMRVRGISRPSR